MKSGLTAIVAIPTESAWEPIQAVRRLHDRQIRRWMPHVNLLYRFLSGVRPGELVVTKGRHRLVSGATVEVIGPDERAK